MLDISREKMYELMPRMQHWFMRIIEKVHNLHYFNGRVPCFVRFFHMDTSNIYYVMIDNGRLVKHDEDMKILDQINDHNTYKMISN